MPEFTATLRVADVTRDDNVGKLWTMQAGSPIQISDAFTPMNENRFLLRIVIFNGASNTLRFLFGNTATQDRNEQGQDLVAAWEAAGAAIEFSQGATTVTVPGPDHSSNATRDTTESYFWEPPDRAAFLANFFGDSADIDLSSDVGLRLMFPDPPAVPAAPTTHDVGENSITWRWIAPDDGGSAITTYDFRFRKVGAASWTDVTGLTVLEHVATGLESGVQYEGQVLARNAQGASDFSASGTAQTSAGASAPATPVAPTAHNASANSITWRWTAPDDGGSAITTYDFRHRKIGAAAWTDVPNLTVLEHEVTGLDAGTQYEAQVLARNAQGNSSFSDSGTGLTAAAEEPPTAGPLIEQIIELQPSWIFTDDNDFKTYIIPSASPVKIDDAFSGGNDRYLLSVSIRNNTAFNAININIGASPTDSHTVSGQDLDEAWENEANGLYFEQGTENSGRIPGPNHESNIQRDTDERYLYTPPNAQNLVNLFFSVIDTSMAVQMRFSVPEPQTQEQSRKAGLQKLLHVVEIDAVRKSDGDVVTLRYCAERASYDFDGATVEGLVARRGLGDIVFSVDPDGGLSTRSTWSFRLANPASLSSYLSDLEATYYFQDAAVRLRFAFITGAETAGDFVTLFSGTIHLLRTQQDNWEIRAHSTDVDDIPSIPTEKADLVDFINVPREEEGEPLLAVFGSIETARTEAFDFDDDDLVPIQQVDALSPSYFGGRRSKTYGGAFIALNDDRKFFPIANGTQNGALWTPPSKNITVPSGDPIPYTFRHTTAQFVFTGSNKANIVDENITTFAVIQRKGTDRSLDANHIRFDLPDLEAVKQPGVVEEIEIGLRLARSTLETVPASGGEMTGTTESGMVVRFYSRTATPTSLDSGTTLAFRSTTGIAGSSPSGQAQGQWYYASAAQSDLGISDQNWNNWYFSRKTDRSATDPRMSVMIYAKDSLQNEQGEGIVTTAVEVVEMVFRVIYRASKVVMLTPTNVFQSVQGYEDQASHYADGAVVRAAGDALTHPADIALAMLRDVDIGGGQPIANIDVASFAAARAKNPNLRFDFYLDQALTTEGWNNFCWFAGLRLHQNQSGLYQLSVFDDDLDAKAYFSDRENVLVDRDGKSIFAHETTPVGGVKNDFFMRYGWNGAEGRFLKSIIRSPIAVASGTCTIVDVGGTWRATDGNATFQTNGVEVGHLLAVVDGDVYAVASVVSETVVTLAQVDGGAALAAAANVSYYVGSNVDAQCAASADHYGVLPFNGQGNAIRCRFIQDDATAKAFVDLLVEYYTQTRSNVTFLTGYNAINVQAGDGIVIDHPLLPPSQRPSKIADLDGAIDDDDTDVTVSGATSAPDVGTYLRLRSGDVVEIVRVTGSTSTTDWQIARGVADTDARAWADDVDVEQIPDVFQVLQTRYIPSRGQVEITAETI